MRKTLSKPEPLTASELFSDVAHSIPDISNDVPLVMWFTRQVNLYGSVSGDSPVYATGFIREDLSENFPRAIRTDGSQVWNRSGGRPIDLPFDLQLFARGA